MFFVFSSDLALDAKPAWGQPPSPGWRLFRARLTDFFGPPAHSEIRYAKLTCPLNSLEVARQIWGTGIRINAVSIAILRARLSAGRGSALLQRGELRGRPAVGSHRPVADIL